jgi:hypothetical protein
MARVILDAGACGFMVVVRAKKIGEKRFTVVLTSHCDMIKDLNDELKDREFGREIFSTIGDSEIYKLSSRYIKHVSCPLPAAILKAIEVEAGLAVPKDVKMKIEK